MKKVLFAGLVSLLCLAGCSNGDDGSDNKDAAVNVQMTEAALTKADVPAMTDVDANKNGDNINKFAFDFAKKMDVSQSFIYSPYSLHSALSMTAFGAANATYDEMKNVLNLGGDRKEAAKQNGALSLNLRFDGQNETSKFEIANRIWVDSSLEVVSEFSDGMNAYYKAPLQVVDFISYADDVRDIINKWVSNVTSEMIKNLIPEKVLTSNTRMVLVNAIHFDGKWQSKFEHENTYTAKFKMLDKSESDLDMMHQTSYINYYESAENEYKAIVMPYQGNFDMLFILPNKDDGIASVMSSLKENDIDHIMKDSKSALTSISIPKFKIETMLDDCGDMLQSLGMVKAFNEEADFSNMASNQELYISKVIHKAVIEVDEEGTIAAAATAVVMDEKSADPFGEDMKTFNADHPFGFALIHRSSKAILFAGQYLGK